MIAGCPAALPEFRGGHADKPSGDAAAEEADAAVAWIREWLGTVVSNDDGAAEQFIFRDFDPEAGWEAEADGIRIIDRAGGNERDLIDGEEAAKVELDPLSFVLCGGAATVAIGGREAFFRRATGHGNAVCDPLEIPAWGIEHIEGLDGRAVGHIAVSGADHEFAESEVVVIGFAREAFCGDADVAGCLSHLADHHGHEAGVGKIPAGAVEDAHAVCKEHVMRDIDREAERETDHRGSA